MRYLCLLLIASLLPAQNAQAVECFAEFLYWKATEPVDWTLNTNSNPESQFVEYRTLDYEYAPGFRVGVGHDAEWDAKFYYTRYNTTASDSATGELTGAFLGAKESQPPAPYYYFDSGQIESSIDYNMFDLDFGKRFQPDEMLQVRPLVGLRAGWINQSFNSSFQAQYPGLLGTITEDLTEEMTNNFWGIGPKVGIENAITLWQNEQVQVSGIANFYASYLWGFWNVSDTTRIATEEVGLRGEFTKYVKVDDRQFGSVAFQAILGVNMKYRNWTASAGYEINDWLNMCQIFDDATGPHDNDLILQGLTARIGWGF